MRGIRYIDKLVTPSLPYPLFIFASNAQVNVVNDFHLDDLSAKCESLSLLFDSVDFLFVGNFSR